MAEVKKILAELNPHTLRRSIRCLWKNLFYHSSLQQSRGEFRKGVGINPYIAELYHATTAALVIFAALEIAWPGSVLAYLNLNFALLFWLIISIIILISNRSGIT